MQTQYQNIVQLATAVEAARQAQRDLIADTRSLGLVRNGEDKPDVRLAVENMTESFAINDYAHRQIAEPRNDLMPNDATVTCGSL